MISPLEMNGIVTRTQDYSTMKINEDNHAQVGQNVITDLQDQKYEENAIFVQTSDNSDRPDTRHDARDKSKNEYVDTRRRDKKKKLDEEGIVVNKTYSGFDMKI